jgi:hypothetical protein
MASDTRKLAPTERDGKWGFLDADTGEALRGEGAFVGVEFFWQAGGRKDAKSCPSTNANAITFAPLQSSPHAFDADAGIY